MAHGHIRLQHSQAKAAILDTKLYFFCSPQNCDGRALGGPGGPYFPYCSPYFPPLWGPLFFLLYHCDLIPYFSFYELRCEEHLRCETVQPNGSHHGQEERGMVWGNTSPQISRTW